MRPKEIVATVFFMIAVSPAFGQADQFQAANRLIEQQNWREALPILERLVNDYPDAGIFFDRMLDCMVNLKMFEDAIAITENRLDNNSAPQIRIRLAELYHYDGDKQRALEEWHSLIERESANLQIYYNVGNSMGSLREYSEAVSVYNTAREQFKDPQVFTNELADAYLQTGNFTAAIEEYINVIRLNPGMLGSVQQQLLSMRDDELYSIAAVQLEDYLIELETDDISYNILHQLLTWMLLETGQYERALVNGRQYESRTEFTNYSLYTIAQQLLSNNQYELAAEAYNYYASRDNSPLRFQALERQADVYLQWADYLEAHSLSSLGRRKELTKMAYDINVQLLNEAPDYSNRHSVLIDQAEIALDSFGDDLEASRWASMLEQDTLRRDVSPVGLNYVMGRIHMFAGSYTDARQLLTRANSAAIESGMTDKTRYFLSLNDFFNGEYEFARLQLRSLERRNSSFYANDALKLGLWIQEGLSSDSTGRALDLFSDLAELLHKREFEQASVTLLAMTSPDRHPLFANALIETAAAIEPGYIPFLLSLLTVYNEENRRSPLRERLLWEEATLSRMLLQGSDSQPESEDALPIEVTNYLNGLPSPFTYESPPTGRQVATLFEQLIIEYPQGFYAPYAREILRSVTDTEL